MMLEQLELDRPLFFMHIPKTAGNAVGSHLEGHFDRTEQYNQATDLDLSRFFGVLTEEDFRTLRYFRAHLRLTHIMEKFTPLPHLVSIVREPFERVVSLYRFWRTLGRQFFDAVPPDMRRGPEQAQALSFRAFIETGDQFVQNDITNVQSRHFCDASHLRQFSDLPEAEVIAHVHENLAHFDILCSLEYLHLFFWEWCIRFGGLLPGFQPVRNVSERAEPLWQDAAEQAEIAALVRDRNRIDQALYETVRARNEARIAELQALVTAKDPDIACVLDHAFRFQPIPGPRARQTLLAKAA